jgi:hypothetical protein
LLADHRAKNISSWPGEDPAIQSKWQSRLNARIKARD